MSSITKRSHSLQLGDRRSPAGKTEDSDVSRLLYALVFSQVFGLLLGMNTALAGRYVDYYGCPMYCEQSTCLNANDKNFWRYCNLNHPRLPVQIPAWSVVGGPTGCNEPVTGAWYCCRAEGTAATDPVNPPDLTDSATSQGGPRFEKPMINGRMIDHCATWGKDCGRGGANQFCRSRGYDSAASWNTTYGPTWNLGSNRACDSSKCIGFARVICKGGSGTVTPGGGASRPPESYITDLNRQPRRSAKNAGPKFEKPLVNGRMVDHCESWQTSCGRGGADLFCRSRGYDSAAGYNTTFGPTWNLGSDRGCDSSKCIGYVRIICK